MRARLAAFAFVAVLFAFSLGDSRATTVVAYDDAADPVYVGGGPYHTLNGGFGFGPFATNAFPIGPPALQTYVSTSTLNGPPGPDIDTSGKAWGNNVVPGGNTLTIRRSLLNDLNVLGTFSVLLDTGDVDGQETVSFGLGNQAMCQFYYNALNANYKFYDAFSNVTIDTGIQQTFGGLSLTLTRLTSSTYSFQAIRLTDSLPFSFGGPYNTSIFTAIRTVTVTNTDGGQGGGHAMFINRLEATDVPEPASLGALSLAAGAVLLRRRK